MRFGSSILATLVLGLAPAMASAHRDGGFTFSFGYSNYSPRYSYAAPYYPVRSYSPIYYAPRYYAPIYRAPAPVYYDRSYAYAPSYAYVPEVYSYSYAPATSFSFGFSSRYYDSPRYYGSSYRSYDRGYDRSYGGRSYGHDYGHGGYSHDEHSGYSRGYYRH